MTSDKEHMRIAFTGPHGSGKTTLLNIIKEYPEFKEYELVTGVTRRLNKEGLPINEQGTDATQLAIIDAHESYLLNPHIIADRSVLDVYCYTQYLYNHGNLSLFTLEWVKNKYSSLLPKYDVLFYITPEFKIEDDGVRSTNQEFQDEVGRIFTQRVYEDHLYTRPRPRFIELTGTIEERVDIINKYFKDRL